MIMLGETCKPECPDSGFVQGIGGFADADATVAVNGNLAYALPSGDRAYFFGSDDFDNSAGGGFAELEVSAVVSDGTNDLVSIATNRVFVPPANETYAYDADGNQTLVTTGTGAWQVEYNGENRPVKWTRVSSDSTTPNSTTPTLVSMTFDHQGRRRLYVEIVAGVTNKLHRFTYDDYVCIARNREVDAQHGMGSDAFIWDPTEPLATRPLACSLAIPQSLDSSTFFYSLDGNKNVTELIGEGGEIAAHYEYSAFGKTLRLLSADGHTDSLNPLRFSSEYADDATRLVYYNYRHYEPGVGRWIGRDPIEEIGGVGLYSYCQNNRMLRFDYIGKAVLTLFIPPSDNFGKIQARFDKWYENEKQRLSHRDANGKNWVERLPHCPKELKRDGDDFVSPDQNEWKKTWYFFITQFLWNYHPGGKYELRTRDPGKYGGSGNQCIYDECGKLITSQPGAGTADYSSPEGDRNHIKDDVDPFDDARYLDQHSGGGNQYIKKYYEVRPSW